MARKTFVMPADTRDALVDQADALASKLIQEQGLDKEDATDLVATVVGEGLELVLELAGMPDPAADAVGKAAGAKAKALAGHVMEALRPDPEKLLEKATAALKAGQSKKARRLFARADRIIQRQASE